nr:hypothetical protein [Verrucomicrobiota bacterium JB025]
MFVASMVILINLNPTTESSRRAMQAASQGELIHKQMAHSDWSTAISLHDTIADGDFATKKRLLKRAAEDSSALAQGLELLTNPRADEAQKISDEIAAQPSQNKFSAALEAVAVVMQVRKQDPPTDAERRRAELFHGVSGLETALMLGKERELLMQEPAFANSVNAIAGIVPVAAEISETLNGFYEAGAADSQAIEALQTKVDDITNVLRESDEGFAKLNEDTYKDYVIQQGEEFHKIQESDIGIVVGPYALMGGFLILVVLVFAWKLPKGTDHEGDKELHIGATVSRLFKNGHYVFGVVAQAFYVGVQIMCWTFIIQYAEAELGIAKSTAQNCNILAMVIFVSSRFICTFLLHYFRPGALLATLAGTGLLLILGTIFIQGYVGLYCLIATSACMSLMFPTIYGIALDGLGDDAKLGSAGLILAIGGGCLMPPLQASIIDLPPINLGFMELASVRASFFLPAICFVVIAVYGIWVNFQSRQRSGHSA